MIVGGGKIDFYLSLLVSTISPNLRFTHHNTEATRESPRSVSARTNARKKSLSRREGKEREASRKQGVPSGGEDEGWRRRDDGRRRPGDPRGDPDQLRSRAAGLPPMPPRQDLRPGTLLRRRLLSHMAAG